MSKKLSTMTVVALAALIAMPLGALAQTSTVPTSLQAQLDAIKALTAQIQALQAQLDQAKTQRQAALVTLAKTLRTGSSGNDVKTLQAILAADATIFPEGQITGFFGPLTAKAVRRFQKKHGLEQVGAVGPKTLKLLNDFLEANPMSFEAVLPSSTLPQIASSSPHFSIQGRHGEDDDREEEHRPCAIVPPGHLIAPGWLRHHHGDEEGRGRGDDEDRGDGENEDDNEGDMVIPPCQTLPPGIINQIGSSTADTTAPVLSLITATNITASGAHITWTTNEAATSKVWFGTVNPVNTASSSFVSDGNFVLNHDLSLTGLVAGTTYFFVVNSQDAAGNAANSAQFSFTTAAAADVTPPVISGVGVTTITTSSAHIVWNTNKNADSKLWYGASSPVFTSTTPALASGVLGMSHDLLVSNLSASTTYFFVVGSADASGNAATSSQASFTTAALPVAPLISAVTAANVASSSAHITWATNVAATSNVWYSTSSPVTVGSAPAVLNGALVVNHDVTLSGLNASTTYFYVVVSADAAANATTASQSSFTTTP